MQKHLDVTHIVRHTEFNSNGVTNMIKRGDTITIKPEWQDKGDALLTWIAVDDEEKGRVTIMPTNTGLQLPSQQVVRVEWLVL